MEYDIVCSESIDMLIEYVNSYFKDGWKCQGGIGKYYFRFGTSTFNQEDV